MCAFYSAGMLVSVTGRSMHTEMTLNDSKRLPLTCFVNSARVSFFRVLARDYYADCKRSLTKFCSSYKNLLQEKARNASFLQRRPVLNPNVLHRVAQGQVLPFFFYISNIAKITLFLIAGNILTNVYIPSLNSGFTLSSSTAEE